MNLPSEEPSVELAPKTRDLDAYARKYGKRGYLARSSSLELLEVWQLDFTLYEFSPLISAGDTRTIKCIAHNIPGVATYLDAIIATMGLDWSGRQYNVPVDGKWVAPPHNEIAISNLLGYC